jgi:hypothetical protein
VASQGWELGVGMDGSGRWKWWHGRLGGVGRNGNELTGGVCESAVGKRRGGLANCAIPRRKCNPTITPRCFGRTGPTKVAAAYGWRAGWRGWTGPAWPDPWGDSNQNLIFLNFKDFWNLARL